MRFAPNTIVTLADWYRNSVELRGAQPGDYLYDFLSNDAFVFLGEIANMRGHGIFVGRDGKVYWGFHVENFRRVSEDDV